MSETQRSASPPPSGSGGFLALFPSIMLPMFLATMDQTIVAAALPAIAGELGDAERISWVVVAYLIAATIASPVYGRLGDIFGRRRLMLVALWLVIAASVLCGLANSVVMLTVMRVVQGFGGGGLMTLSQALIGETVPPRERARYQGFLATVTVFSTAFGALAGGLLTQHFGWRTVFFVSVPLGLLAIFLVRRLPIRPASSEPFRFDIPGLLLFVVFITSTLVMFREAQAFTAAVLWPSLGLFAVGMAAIVLLVRRERRAAHPLFPISLFRNPSIWRADGLALCHGAALVALLTFLPIYLRVGLGADAGQIGLILLPVTICVPLGSILTGLLVTWTGRTAIFPSIGLIAVVLTMAAVSLWLPALDATGLALLLGLATLFMGTVMAVVQLTVQATAGAGMLGAAAASVQLSRSIGATLGTAFVGAVLFGTMAVSDPDAARLFALILQQGPDVLQTVPAARAAVIQAEIADAFRVAFLTITGFSVAATVLAWSLPLRRL